MTNRIRGLLSHAKAFKDPPAFPLVSYDSASVAGDCWAGWVSSFVTSPSGSPPIRSGSSAWSQWAVQC